MVSLSKPAHARIAELEQQLIDATNALAEANLKLKLLTHVLDYEFVPMIAERDLLRARIAVITRVPHG